MMENMESERVNRGFVSEGLGNLSRTKRMLLEALLKAAEAGQGDPVEKEKSKEYSQSPLITMRSRGEKTPFFCIHALLGSVYHYHALANHMDKEQPFYALQAPGLDGVEESISRVEDFAALYKEEIRSVQPRGPYRLGGYSFGGWIAFETARQLVSENEKVDFLAIFGSGIPLSIAFPPLFRLLEFLGKYLKDFKQNIVLPFFSNEDRIALGVKDRKINLPLLRLVLAHNRAALHYNPKPYAGKIHFFETIEQQIFAPMDPSRGWGRLCVEEVETDLISGNHLSMLDEPHVKQLAKKLSESLDKCDEL